MTNSIKKENTEHLDDVFEINNRTIAIKYITNGEDLAENWHSCQVELSSKYQYEAINKYVWDYYLIFVCNFDENSLDHSLRYKIENDKFCSRKKFIFDSNKKNFDTSKIEESVFPMYKIGKRMEILKTDTIWEKMKFELKESIDSTFLKDVYSSEQLSSLLEKIIKNEKAGDV